MRAFLLTTIATLLSMCAPAAAENAVPVLGYVALYVKDVPRSVAFYEAAFGVARRHVTEMQEYGEMQTGTTRLGFVNMSLVERIAKTPVPVSGASPSGSEIGFVTADVAGLYKRAVTAGAVPVSAPEEKPWKQTVAYVRDLDGHLVEICTPLS